MVKKAFWVLVAVAILGYLANNYFENKAREEAERTATLKKEKATRAAVNKMVARTNARDDWDEKLSRGERIRFTNILSIELEKLWIGDRPILFRGAIDDVSTISETKYRVIFSRNIFINSLREPRLLGTDLLLDLECDKSMIDSILKSHPEIFEGLGLNNGVAVVGKINTIKTDYKIGEEGEKQEIRIGIGSCVDIVYTGIADFGGGGGEAA